MVKSHKNRKRVHFKEHDLKVKHKKKHRKEEDDKTEEPEEGETCGDYNFKVAQIKNGLKNGAVQCKPKRLPVVPSHLPKLPALFGAFGTCGAGKTNTYVNLIAAYQKHNSINDLYIMSPTYDSNASLQTLQVDPSKVYKEAKGSIAALLDIKKKILQSVELYEIEKEYKRIYKKFMKEGTNQLTFQEISLLSSQNYREPVNIPWPQPCIFIDDMTHTELMVNTINNELSHLALHHRHLEGVGVTIMMAFQTFKSGMPKVIRTNLGCALLYPTCNMKEIEEIYGELANHVSYKTFKQLLFEATKEPHGFLFINKNEKDPSKQFGINFDKNFIVDILEERRKILKI